MFNTFHAGWFFLRWPLDHLFHSEHFRLVSLQRGPAFGSDHFPMVVTLELDPTAQREQEPPEPDVGDEREAQEKEQRAQPDSHPSSVPASAPSTARRRRR
jgi:hypothetical protein